MGNKDSVKRERVMLPATSDGQPDYALMERVGKLLMYRKYGQYLDYVNSKAVSF